MPEVCLPIKVTLNEVCHIAIFAQPCDGWSTTEWICILVGFPS